MVATEQTLTAEDVQDLVEPLVVDIEQRAAAGELHIADGEREREARRNSVRESIGILSLMAARNGDPMIHVGTQAITTVMLKLLGEVLTLERDRL